MKHASNWFDAAAHVPNKNRPMVSGRRPGRGIELRQEESVVRLVPHPRELSPESLFGFATDGTLLFVVTEKGRPVAAGAFGATQLEGSDCSVRGDGFLSWTAPDSGTHR